MDDNKTKKMCKAVIKGRKAIPLCEHCYQALYRLGRIKPRPYTRKSKSPPAPPAD